MRYEKDWRFPPLPQLNLNVCRSSLHQNGPTDCVHHNGRKINAMLERGECVFTQEHVNAAMRGYAVFRK